MQGSLTQLLLEGPWGPCTGWGPAHTRGALGAGGIRRGLPEEEEEEEGGDGPWGPGPRAAPAIRGTLRQEWALAVHARLLTPARPAPPPGCVPWPCPVSP